ncbi:MAG: hypothetical protein ACYTGF_13810, partial [Planctomycetota bacterium]
MVGHLPGHLARDLLRLLGLRLGPLPRALPGDFLRLAGLLLRLSGLRLRDLLLLLTAGLRLGLGLPGRLAWLIGRLRLSLRRFIRCFGRLRGVGIPWLLWIELLGRVVQGLRQPALLLVGLLAHLLLL